VDTGEGLVEVAPAGRLRVTLEADQSDVAYLADGAPGRFVLKARPERSFDFTVRKIRPVAEARKGSTVFVVEGEIAEAAEWLRPGMAGAGSIGAGRRNVAWAYGHRIVDWLRFKLF
jgi:hypothetical protein